MVALLRDSTSAALSFDQQSRIAEARHQGRGSNWIHQSLAVVRTERCGFGVIATAPIAAKTTVVVFAGIVLTQSEFDDLSHEMQNFPFQIADDLFLGPRDENDIGVGERINHSCAPNVGFSGAIALVTLRDIEAGEELTLDYATCVASNDDAFAMHCECGAPGCRSKVTGQDWALPEVQVRLFPYFQPFLQEKILQRRDSGKRPSAGATLLPLDRAANVDQLQSVSVEVSRFSLTRVALAPVSFAKNALRREWLAIPICVLAGIPSTLVTCWLVAVLEPLLAKASILEGSFAHLSSVAMLSSVIGYITYLMAYYTGMLFKERNEWFAHGQVDAVALRRKAQVIFYDFIAHLPSDVWLLPVMGASQGGLYVAGLSQFWSIFLSLSLADLAYAVKEPFYWHGAKEFVAWRERRNAA